MIDVMSYHFVHASAAACAVFASSSSGSFPKWSLSEANSKWRGISTATTRNEGFLRRRSSAAWKREQCRSTRMSINTRNFRSGGLYRHAGGARAGLTVVAAIEWELQVIVVTAF